MMLKGISLGDKISKITRRTHKKQVDETRLAGFSKKVSRATAEQSRERQLASDFTRLAAIAAR